MYYSITLQKQYVYITDRYNNDRCSKCFTVQRVGLTDMQSAPGSIQPPGTDMSERFWLHIEQKSSLLSIEVTLCG